MNSHSSMAFVSTSPLRGSRPEMGSGRGSLGSDGDDDDDNGDDDDDDDDNDDEDDDDK